jgi:hypothetical protein
MMEKSVFESEVLKSIEELSAILLELRNALTALSLILRDWQFESDLEQRSAIEHTVTQILQRIATLQDPFSL